MRAWYSTLAVSIVIMPIVGSIITLGLYFLLPTLQWPQWWSVVGGPVIAFALWLAIGGFWSLAWVVRTDRSDGSSALVLQLKWRLERIKAHLMVLKPKSSGATTPTTVDKASEIAYQEASEFVVNVEAILDRASIGPLSIFGHDHLAAWRAIHRAEEDLLLLDPTKIAVERGLHDLLRIENFPNGKQEKLLQLEKKAIKRLDPSAQTYLEDDQHCGSTTVNSTSSTLDPLEEWNARNMLHEVRRAFNDLRDDRCESILHLRNQLIRGLVGAELITFALLSLVIVTIVSNPNPSNQSAFIAAVTVYIIGAMAGLFGRFFGEADLSGLSADYGLSIVLLISTPVFSGLAGVGGVFITQVFSGLSHNTLTSIPAAFVLSPFNLFTAAVFGLTPNLVMQNLARMTRENTPKGREPFPPQMRPGAHV